MREMLSPRRTGSVLRDSQSRDLRALTAEAAALLQVTFGRTRTEFASPDEDADGGAVASVTIPDLCLIPALWRIDGHFKVPCYLQRPTAVNADAGSADGRGSGVRRGRSGATSFLRIGAFVGLLREVVSRSASNYAKGVYRVVFGGHTPGGMARQAGYDIRSSPSDPTWLIGIVYGDPAANVSVASAPNR
jgi:hypothetical protein